MGTLEEKNTGLATLDEFSLDLKVVKEYLPKMMKSTNAAMLAMSQITAISSDEMDVHANNTLVKVKKTYDLVSGQRKDLTDSYDEFKKSLMLIEGELDPKKGRDNDYNRIRILREGFAQVKLDKRRKEEEELARQKLVANKLIDLKAALIENIEIGPINLMAKAENVLNSFAEGLTLENFEGEAKKLDYTPKLKKEVYEGWFVVNLDMSGVDEGKITEVIDEVKNERSYDKVNKSYQKGAIKRLGEWKGKLPEIKKRLEAIAAASEEEAKKLKEQLKAKAKVEKEEEELRLKKEKEDKERDIKGAASDDKLEAEFREQGGKQNLDDARINAKFVARFDQDNWVRPFAEVVYHCASHPKFKGIYAKERSGETKQDDKGRDQYIDPIDWFMKFFATNCDATIEGLKLYQDAKTQARKKKE